MRRGNTVEATVAILCVMVLCFIALCWAGVSAYTSGYRNGQIDALEGTVEYESVEVMGAGTYWYERHLPEKLYPSRKKDD